MKASEFNLHDYRVITEKGTRLLIPVLHSKIPRNERGIGFDIYDYDMLFNDEGTKKIIRDGNTIGCFYIESPGMRSLLKRLSCDTFEMLTAASSVIRPGVAESGMMQEFIARHKNPKLRKYLLPEMEKYLGETYGVMIYQEDVIKVAHHVAGLTLEDADFLRRAMSGKLRSRAAMEKISKKFFDSCRKKNINNKKALELWRQIESFAGYAFCKAHSASFALLSFQVAYLKVHFPAEFMASVLSNGGGYYSAAVYIQEAKRMELTILLPDINESFFEYFGENNKIRIGFMAIKNLSENTIKSIVKERKLNGKFVSLADFIVRTHTGYEETALLIKCGAMDCFGQTRPTLMRLLDIYIARRKLLSDEIPDLFINETFQLEKEVITDRQYSPEEICTIEYELFGYMVTRHPLEFYTELLNGKNIISADTLQYYQGKNVRLVGWYMTSKRIKTRKGEIMKFLSLEDLTGTFEAVLFPKTYEQFASLTFTMGPYIVEGKADTEAGNNVIVEKLSVISNIGVKSSVQLDSAEKQYAGDNEKVSEDELHMAELLNTKKLVHAYAV